MPWKRLNPRIVNDSLNCKNAVHIDMNRLSKEGWQEEALKTMEAMQQKGSLLTRNDAYYLLRSCEKGKQLEYGKRVQFLMSHNGLDSIAVLGDHLIRFFGYHGILHEANRVFHRITEPNAHTWAAVILANAKLGQGRRALQIYNQSLICTHLCDKYIYVAVLKACTMTKDITEGKIIHVQMIQRTFQSNVVIYNILIDMYAKCGSLEEAQKVFKSWVNQDVVSWNTIIAAYVQHGESHLALETFMNMNEDGFKPDEVTLLATLKACAGTGEVEQGRVIHDQVISQNFPLNVVLGSALIDMYVKCGSLEEAIDVFEKLPNRNIVSWGAMIAGYVQHGESYLALTCYENMLDESIPENEVIFLNVLKACACIGSIEQGRLIHENILERKYQSDLAVGCTLIDMYVKCGSLLEAQEVFAKLHIENVVLWNAMVAGYVQNFETDLALKCFEDMQIAGLSPNEVTFLSILKSCAYTGELEQGRLIHNEILENMLQTNLILGNTLVDMYAKCGSLEEAELVFAALLDRSVVSWGALIVGYSQHGEGALSLACFEMMEDEGIQPNEIIISSILKACASIGAMEYGRLIHERVIRNRIQSDIVVGNTLVSMYAKCGGLEEARKIFYSLPTRTPVSWGAIITGYAQHGEGILAVECYERMQQDGVLPNAVTCLSILKACATLGTVEQGRFVHQEIIKMGIESDITIGSTLVDMYAKCGSLSEAFRVFNKLSKRNAVSWNSIIAGYGQHGNILMALGCLETMHQEGIQPVEASFSSIFIACSRAGLVDEGCWYFFLLGEYKIIPSISHCTCMIDLLARAGLFREAKYLLESTVKTNLSGWMALFAASKMHGNVQLGRHCFDQITSLDSHFGAGYILVSNMYADLYREENAIIYYQE